MDTLFTKYGNGTVMTFEGFEHLMYGIQLGNLIMEDTIEAHQVNNLTTNFKPLHQLNHSHVVDLTLLGKDRRHVQHNHGPSYHEESDSVNNKV